MKAYCDEDRDRGSIWIGVVLAVTVTILGLIAMVTVANQWKWFSRPARVVLPARKLEWTFVCLQYAAQLIRVAVRRRPFALVASR